MNPEDKIQELISKSSITTNAQTENRILGDALVHLDRLKQQKSPGTGPFIWRIIMKSSITKFAAAAIIIAVLIGIYQFGSTAPAFADIVQPLLTARTAVFKFTTCIEGGPTETMDCMVMEDGRTREIRPGGVIRILDQNQNIMLYPAEKKAVIFKRINIPEDQQSQTPEQSGMFHEIREDLRRAKDVEDESVRFLGKQETDGVMAFGYRTGKNGDRTVWADAKTLLPIRIEYSLDNSTGPLGIKGGTITYSDFVFNVEMDESLFVVPEGYDVNTLEQDASKNREEDMIQGLRLWSENTDGTFPSESELNMRSAGKVFELVKEKMGLKFKKGDPPDFAKPRFSEFYPIRLKIIRGLGFIFRLRRSSESDWHYAGNGVKFGDADTAILWYRPVGSETYRVIYGDLSIKDVKPENLPE